MKKKTRFKWLLTTEIVASVAIVAVIIAVPTAVIYTNNEKTANEDTTDNPNEGTGGDTSSDDPDGGGTTEIASPIDNSSNRYSITNSSTNQMVFAGYYGDGVGSSNNMNTIVSTITPNVTLQDSSTWTSSSGTSGNITYTKYMLTIDNDFTYIRNFISVTNWYNETSSTSLSVQLTTSDLDYDALTDWNVSLSLNVYSDSSYEFVYSINPVSNDVSTNPSSYQFILYTKYTFGTTFTNGNRGEAAAATPVDNFLDKYVVDSDLLTFAGYVSDNASETVMNQVVNTITPNISLSDSSTWTSSTETTSSDTTYTRYELVIDDDFTYIKNFISVTNWYNETSSTSLSVQLATSDLDYDILADWKVSLALNVYSTSSYEFIYSINPVNNDSTSTDSNSYQFILYTKYTFGTTFTNGNRGEAVAATPVDNFFESYETYNDSITFEFVGYYGVSGTTINETVIGNIVNTITPGYTLDNINDSGIWVYDESSSDSSNNVYNLTIATETDIEYAKNFISLSDVWYNRTTSESNELSQQLYQSDIYYDVLLDWDVTISLKFTTNYQYYLLIYTITPKDEQNSDTTNYQFTLYSQYNFNKTFSVISKSR